MTSSLLDISGLTFSAGGRTILDQLDLAIHPKEIHAILGANGSGKTTLAYLLMGCEGYTPTAGTIRFAGTDLLPLKMHERANLGLTHRLAGTSALRRRHGSRVSDARPCRAQS